MDNFWQKLNKPFFCLAPMADVTDCAFRQIIATYGKPDVFWTEFVSADGLAHPVAREKLLIDFKYTEGEHPIVAQIFGSRPENMRIAAKLCAELGFDGIDINMGCPDRSIEKQGAGAAMIRTPGKVHEIIEAVRVGSREGARELPVSVKTRIGYNKNEIAEWIPALLKENLAALTVHLRTRKEMSLVPAHWDLMKEIVALRDKLAPDTLIIGNGDVLSITHARELVKETGCDGVMLGKAIFGNPFLFSSLQGGVAESRGGLTPPPIGTSPYKGEEINQKLSVMVEHTKLFEELLGGVKNFAIMKKHYKAYVNGFDGAKELRIKLMEAENAGQVEEIVKEFIQSTTL